jgi:ankyrin repeat protein
MAPALFDAVRTGDATGVAAAIAAGAPIWNRREALELAVYLGRTELAATLLAAGAWPDHAGRRFGRWGGCVHVAVWRGHDTRMIATLLDGGARPRARDVDGRTPLGVAVRTAHDDAEALLRSRGARDDEIDDADRALGAVVRGVAPPAPPPRWLRGDHLQLCWALRRKRGDLIPALLALGLDPNIVDDDGTPALHLAGRDAAARDALLAAGARADAVDFAGVTADFRSVERVPDATVERAADLIVAGDLAALTALLDEVPALVRARLRRRHHGPLLHYVAANGVEAERQRTPANIAAVAALLLARGAEPDAWGLEYGGGAGQTTLALAVTSAFPDQAGVMTPLVEALVAGGASVNGPDGRDAPIRYALPSAWPALVAAGAVIDLPSAAALGRLDQVRARIAPDGALQPGATCKPEDRVVDAALIAAARGGHTEIVAYLLDAGADLAATDGPIEMTALHHAAGEGHVDAARVLVARGAPLELRNHWGGTPLDYARWVAKTRGCDRAAIGALLVVAGARDGA